MNGKTYLVPVGAGMVSFRLGVAARCDVREPHLERGLHVRRGGAPVRRSVATADVTGAKGDLTTAEASLGSPPSQSSVSG